MKKNLLFLAISAFLSVQCIAQTQDSIPAAPEDPYKPAREKQTASFKDRLFFGGDIGLQFGSITYVNLSPIVGYKLTERLGIGLGPMYAYLNDKRFTGYEYTANSYGGRLFGQYMVIENAMAYSEFSMVNSDVIDDITYVQKRVNIPSLLVGGGYVTPIGDASSFNIMVLFNLIEDRFSYYENPIIRAGVNVGF